MLGNGVGRNVHAEQKRVQLAIPPPSLLLDRLAHTTTRNGDLHVDLRECARISQSDAVDPQLALYMCNILDAARDVIPLHEHTVSLSCLRFDTIITSQTLPELHKSVMDASFFAPLSCIKNRITHLMSKVINIPCQARMFPEVACRYLNPNARARTSSSSSASSNRRSKVKCKKHTDEFRNVNLQLRQLFLCSLLGNYDHCDPLSRPCRRVRRRLYQAFLGPAHVIQFILDLVMNCDLLLNNALREYMVHKIDDDLALKAQLADLIQFDEFKSIVVRCMSLVRAYFSDMLKCPSSSLSIMLDAYQRNDESMLILATRKSVYRDINEMMKPSHSEMLATAYVRPSLHSDHQLLKIRKEYPLIRMDHRRADENDEEEEHEEYEDPKLTERKAKVVKFLMQNGCTLEEVLATEAVVERAFKQQQEQGGMDDALPSVLSSSSSHPLMTLCTEGVRTGTYNTRNKRGKRKKKKYKSKARAGAGGSDEASPEAQAGRLKLLNFVTEQQYSALKEVVLKERPLAAFVVNRVIEWFPFFSVPDDVVAYIRDILSQYHSSEVTIETLLIKLGTLNMVEPHAYNLLQIVAEIIRDAVRHMYCVNMPYHILVNQIAAVQTKHRLCGTNNILPSSIHFVYCSICNMVYSLVKEWGSPFKRTYEHGLRDASVSYSDDKRYCRNDKVTYNGRCKAQPLTEVCILGRMLIYNGKMYMICPQVGCGSIMVLDSTRCIFNARGPGCCACTAEYQNHSVAYIDEAKKHLERIVGGMKCTLCHRDLTNQNSCYIYPAGNYTCGKHNYKRLREAADEYVRTRPASAGPLEHAEMKEFLLRTTTEITAQFKEMNKDKIRRKNLVSKLAAMVRKTRSSC